MSDSVRFIELLERVRRGDVEAETEFLIAADVIIRREQRRWLASFLLRFDFAEDARQEALFAVWAARMNCHATTDGGVAAWVRAIALHCATDVARFAFRGTDSRMVSIDAAEAHATMHPDATAEDAQTAYAQLRTVLEFITHEFGERGHTLLWMRLVQGSSWQEVGTELGTSWTAARRRFQRLVAVCRRRLPAPASEGHGSGASDPAR